MSQAQLARAMGKTPMWVSLRLRGLQPIDLNDLLLFARALNVGVHQLLPSEDDAAGAADPRLTAPYLGVAEQSPIHTVRPRDNRPIGHPSGSPGRTGYVVRPSRRKRDR